MCLSFILLVAVLLLGLLKSHVSEDQLFYHRVNYSTSLSPRRDNDLNYGSFDQTTKDWCVNVYDNTQGLVNGFSWGTMSKSDQEIWKEKKCGLAIADHMMNSMFKSLHSRETAIIRARQLDLKNKKLVSNIFRDKSFTELIFFAADENVVKYELRYPWYTYICPGTLALDIGANIGDTALPMAAATRGGVVLSFELALGYYLAVEWTVRLNPHLNIIPYNLGVTSDAQNRSNKNKRLVPIFPWLKTSVLKNKNDIDLFSKISFIKIDIDGLDISIINSFQVFSTIYRPLMLIEWFLPDRATGCRAENSIKIWQVAKSMNYSVWNWQLKKSFTSCNEAVAYFNSNMKKESTKVKSITDCGNNENDDDLCDLTLIPNEVVISEREKYCPKPLSSQEIHQLMVSQNA